MMMEAMSGCGTSLAWSLGHRTTPSTLISIATSRQRLSSVSVQVRMMRAAGIGLNTLSLFGLMLSIGIVVDDAIVVMENVERYLSQGYSPKEAAHETMDEVGGALIAIALVLCAVFIPTAFISGLQGVFYKQ